MIEERSRFRFRFCSSDESDRETEDILEFLIPCFREDSVLFDTDSEVTDVVDSLGLESAEVFGSRECDVDELIDE